MSELPNKINWIAISAFATDSGILTQPAQFVFQYQQDNPISLTMQYKNTPINHGSLHPIFSQNLPEGYVRYYISEKLRRFANVNDMYLLALQFDKAVGHLSFKSKIEQPPNEKVSLNDILKWQGKSNLFEQLLDKFYLNGLVSGVQPKVLINATNDTKTPSVGRSLLQQQDYIIKTFDQEFPLLTVNEYVCMQAAKACGLAPSQCWLSEDLQTFVTARFDKPNGKKLGIEDFAVLMGKQGDAKYHSSYESLLKATLLYTQSPSQVRRLYQYIVFNCLIGNGDAHLKNFAIRYDKSRQNIQLTPPYDITHTLIYPTIDDKMALKLAGNKSFPDRNQLIKLGTQNNITNPAHIIDHIADTISDFINQSNEVLLIKPLKDSIYKSINIGTSKKYTSVGYIHDKNKKFE